MTIDEIIAELPRLSRAELAEVQAKVRELAEAAPAEVPPPPADPIATHPALGIWRDRTDLPADPAEASGVLRERMMRHADSAAS
jgi:hypothetical protein